MATWRRLALGETKGDTMAMSKAVLREELITIIVKAAARGKGNGSVPVDAEYAATILDALVADDSAPEWDACVAGQATLRKVVRIYRSMP